MRAEEWTCGGRLPNQGNLRRGQTPGQLEPETGPGRIAATQAVTPVHSAGLANFAESISTLCFTFRNFIENS